MLIYKCPTCGREYSSNKAYLTCNTCGAMSADLELIESDTFNPKYDVEKCKDNIESMKEKQQKLIDKYKCVREYVRLMQDIYMEEQIIQEEME